MIQFRAIKSPVALAACGAFLVPEPFGTCIVLAAAIWWLCRRIGGPCHTLLSFWGRAVGRLSARLRGAGSGINIQLLPYEAQPRNPGRFRAFSISPFLGTSILCCVDSTVAVNDPKGIIALDPFWIKRNFGMLTIEQIRAARGLLGWSQSELADRAGLSLPTVKRVEGDTGPRVSDLARTKLRRALESAGVEFIDENGGGPGVRLRKRTSKRSK
jgi:DNA-binding XRE family transcriptional regulator